MTTPEIPPKPEGNVSPVEMSGPVPEDSRYISFPQLLYCCTPASILSIMYKQGLPLVHQEELGWHMGLTAPPEKAGLFWNPRIPNERPAAGYGTQISKPEYDPNVAFKNLGIPLKFTRKLIDNFVDAEAVRRYIQDVERQDRDVLACFRYGTLYDTDFDGGHVSVFDRYLPDTDQVRLIDPATNVPTWRLVTLAGLFQAMEAHGPGKSGGFWEIEPILGNEQV